MLLSANGDSEVTWPVTRLRPRAPTSRRPTKWKMCSLRAAIVRDGSHFLKSFFTLKRIDSKNQTVAENPVPSCWRDPLGLFSLSWGGVIMKLCDGKSRPSRTIAPFVFLSLVVMTPLSGCRRCWNLGVLMITKQGKLFTRRLASEPYRIKPHFSNFKDRCDVIDCTPLIPWRHHGTRTARTIGKHRKIELFWSLWWAALAAVLKFEHKKSGGKPRMLFWSQPTTRHHTWPNLRAFWWINLATKTSLYPGPRSPIDLIVD